MNFSDSFYSAGFTNCADYNYFADFVKIKITPLTPLRKHPQRGRITGSPYYPLKHAQKQS